ncbi:hypothetical protein Fmac_013621 [Flemingia macrophylla]|uniref:Uncharacterized protein n=1 Tax=Flemingia macrophylla TaxID=520843 RepID=A0ABD1MTM8_9FABA
MSQQGPSSNVPVKRKRGRPRKYVTVVQGENVPTAAMRGPYNVLNSNQTTGTGDHEMLGKTFTGVIDGTFDAGYLLNVQVGNTDNFLRGVVFLPEQVAPVTEENDVAPHVKMIKRKEIPILDLNTQADVHDSVPPSVQFNKQCFEPELLEPVPEEQVLNTQQEIHGFVYSSIQCNKQCFELESPEPVSEERVLNTQQEIHVSVPSVQCNKQCFEPESPEPVSKERVLNTQQEIHVSVPSSVQCNKHCLDPEPQEPVIPGSVPSSVQSNKQCFEPESPEEHVSDERVHNTQQEIHVSVPSSVQCNKQCLDPESQEPVIHGSVPSSVHSNKQCFDPESPEPVIHGSVSSSVHSNKQCFEPESLEPVSEERAHNTQQEIHGSVSSSAQRYKQSFEPELLVPMSEEQVLNPQAEMHGYISSSVQCNRQSFEPELLAPMSEERFFNPQSEIHGSISSPVQCNKQCFEPELQVPMYQERVLPSEIPSGISGLLETQSASTSKPISSGGIPQETSEPGHGIRSASIMSELDHDKNVEQSETLHELDASTQVKESSADEGETKDSGAAAELINLLPSNENTNKELRTGQQTKLAIETLSNVDTSTSNVRPGTDVVNIPVVESSHALEISQPESMPSEQIGKSVPSESKSSSERHDLCEKRDPQN